MPSVVANQGGSSGQYLGFEESKFSSTSKSGNGLNRRFTKLCQHSLAK